MANIAPFRALRYDAERVFLPQVVTQPYDKITEVMQERYYAASPYNLVRIILGKREPADNMHQNVYTRAASFFLDWRRQGIFLQDPEPSIYAYSQHFTMPGGEGESERRGFIALGRLEDYSAKIVFRHEQTLAKPKADRLDLLRATRAHFGQLFMLYEDSGNLDSLLATGTQPPAIEVKDEYEVLHRVWQVSDPAIIASLRNKMKDKKLVIADGHHRYETALNYRNECRAGKADAGPDAPPEFVMMTFVNMNSPGVVILPTHRVVHGLSSFSAEDFKNASREFFEVEDTNPALDAKQATSRLRENEEGVALLAVTAGGAFLLRRTKAAGSHFLGGFSERQRQLDVVQLHKVLLE